MDHSPRHSGLHPDGASGKATWGIALLNDQETGLAAVCSPDSVLQLVALPSQATLWQADTTRLCWQNMIMTLDVNENGVTIMTMPADDGEHRHERYIAAASGLEEYLNRGQFHAAAVVLNSSGGEQWLLVYEIEALQ